MKLIHFYRQLFVEAARAYEPVWEEEAALGYRWHKRNYPLWEQFQIKDMDPDYPVLIYSLILPEAYLKTTIYEEIKRYPSKYELSIVILNRQIFLNATIQTDKLQDSLMGFLNQARGEFMNILDCIIQVTDEAELQAGLTPGV
ncbi:hypothetical protein [Cohnella mopanensis]|uniref:hypothetical protein n=1 Tax=Cohnella mopanensis TaxID=2911966 RepID=UPI001EF91A3C|nr:hypothetical protein [Cohnella mopanensis]